SFVYARKSRRPRLCLFFVFFFQAEDGIRDRNVTGVQTCALPILDLEMLADPNRFLAGGGRVLLARRGQEIVGMVMLELQGDGVRSEERRVGEEGRAGGGREHVRGGGERGGGRGGRRVGGGGCGSV